MEKYYLPKVKKLIVLLISIWFCSKLHAQTSNLGKPISWNEKINNNTIPLKKMVGFSQLQVDAEDKINDLLKDKPWRFGYKFNTNYTLNHGRWITLPNGDRLWQLVIESKNALTINLLLKDFHLPPKAHLHIYDINKTNVIGAYTERNNRKDGELGTELVHGDKIIVEYFEPKSVKFQGNFIISNVIHGYRSLTGIQHSLAKGLNSSGDCNIDVNCPLGMGWDNEIRSVAMIVVNGNGICTGALINNTCSDGTPYFLTADHCLGGSTGSWAFRFNWESPPGTESCATTAGSTDPGPPYDQTANGATILANSSASDYALLEINNMTLSDAQAWNCYYAGWDASDLTTVTEATGIHHPSGDVKKICRENDSPYHSSAAGAAVWYINQWEEGVTEPGSSGSPLFDQNHRIIGQLYGGAAACSGTINNGQYDYYGRIGVSWNNGLSSYLNPTACGGSVLADDGYDPNTPTLPDDAGVTAISSPFGAYCIDNFMPEVTLKNYGTNNLTSVNINYDIDGGTNNVYQWTGNLTPGSLQVVTFPSMVTPAGAHTFNVYTSSPNGNTDSNPLNDGGSSNYSATIGGLDVLVEINTDCWGSEVTWSIEDSLGNTLVSGGPYADVTGGEFITENICLSVGCYDFIINDSYGDGMYGSQWNSCNVDGDYNIVDVSTGVILASTIAANADYGNQEINNFCVSQACLWSLSSNTVLDTCFGNNNGQITVNVVGGSGPFNFDIGNGNQNSGVFNNLQQGTYTIYVSDTGCTSSIQVNLQGPTPITASFNNTDVTCYGLSDGGIMVSGSGGSPPYTYDFGSGFMNSNSINSLPAGNYTVSVQDVNGCVSSSTATVNEPMDIDAFIVVIDEVNGSDGVINITVSGGNPPYNFNWSGPQGYTSTNEDIGGLVGGTYILNIVDAIGCVSSDTITVNSFVDIENQITNQLKVIPNPSSDMIEIQGVLGDFRVDLYDVTGKFLKSFSEKTIDLSFCSKGLYLLNISNQQSSRMLRVMMK